jgi:DNA-binding HxlR family transcriptional regulator
MEPPNRHVGHNTLALLVEDWSLPILRTLMDGPHRPSQLEQRLPGIPHSALMRRLAELRDHGLARHERRTGLPPSAEYSLTTTGRMVLSVTGAAERWERRWGDGTDAGVCALRSVGDERTRQILLALAAEPLSAAELGSHVPLSRSPLLQRVADLVRRGILTKGPTHRYELTDSARDLMLVAVAAARWEWEFARPSHPPAAANVARILQMYAPRVELAANLRGVCCLNIDDGSAVVHLAAAGRSLESLPGPPTQPVDATCHATSVAWYDGLLLHRWDATISTGDQRLIGAILPSVSAALVA